MWHFLERQQMVSENIVRRVERPKPEKRAVQPLEEHEIKALFSALEKGKRYTRRGKAECENTLPSADRLRAILMFFLDNGVRVSELINIKMQDLDTKNNRCFILGKGAKERYVPFSARTGQVIWHYMMERTDVQPEDYLFINNNGRQLDRRVLGRSLEALGKRAGVASVHPHLLRHTFAVNYLRAGGDIFTLQMILGHEELDMVRRYSQLASNDVSRVHKRASPVDFLRL